MIAPVLMLVLQANGWVAAPSQPTVGDTIQLERTIAAPAGWRVRAGKLASGTVAEPLGDAVVLAAPGAWVVRYAVVAWTPGEIRLDMPPLWRLGPDGTADSLSGGTATFRVASVIPDSLKSPAPQPSLGPLRLDRSSPFPAIAAVLLSADAPLRDLRELLLGLDQVAFATAHGVEVAPLVSRARALARELSANGGRR